MKEAATTLITGHDGAAQITIVVHGGGVVTYQMSEATFYRHVEQAAKVMAEKISARSRKASHER